MCATPVRIFYSYAEEDEDLRSELSKHLRVLNRQGVIEEWHFRMISGGQEWKGKIDYHLNHSQIVLLLISADFVNSDYCYDVEMTRALELHENGTARVVPVILRPVDWQSAPFGKLQALPTKGKAVTSWTNLDEAFLDIETGIKIICRELSDSKTTVQSPPLSVALGGSQIFCARCGTKPGVKSVCTGVYTEHDFQPYSGNVYCSRCGVAAGRQSVCTGTYTSHNLQSYPNDAYCNRCGSKAGIQSICTGIHTAHDFRSY